MSEDVGQTDRAIGRLEGRLGAMETRQAEAESRHVRENAELRATQSAMNVKLDAILAKLNQGIGGYRMGMLFAGLIGSLFAAGWTLWERFSK